MAKKKYKLNLALQGGGAHGAFTWGVLDRLLEEDDISITGISGTSAGAMNAVLFVDGYAKKGAEGARENMERFWMGVSNLGRSNPLSYMYRLPNVPSFLDVISKTFSPYQLNPLNLNPLRNILEGIIDTDQLNSCTIMRLFITATNVRTGQPKVFQCEDMSIEAVLASACLPQLFQAVEIDGEAYWDGGYMGNPAIWPLIYHTNVDDILLVQINPIRRNTLPTCATEIMDRVNEINFNSSLIAEMRAINFVSKLVRDGKLKDDEYKNIRMHMIEANPELNGLKASTKLNYERDFFMNLKKLGRKEAERWIEEHKKQIGKEATLDIEKNFLLR